MGEKQIIPFCTHDDLMHLKSQYIEAIAIVTHEADKIDYEFISAIGGFGYDGKVEDSSDYSNKVLSRKDINIKDLAEKFNMSNKTVSRHLKRIQDVSIGSSYMQLIEIDNNYDDLLFRINHKAYEKYYTLIDKDILRELIKINGTAIKLYLLIKYNYEYNKSINKPCILSLDYLASKMALKDTKYISSILKKMDGIFIKRSPKIKTEITIKNGKVKNSVKKYHEYEIIEKINSYTYDNNNEDDLPW